MVGTGLTGHYSRNRHHHHHHHHHHSDGRTDEDERSAPRGSVGRAGIAVDDGFGLARKSEP